MSSCNESGQPASSSACKQRKPGISKQDEASSALQCLKGTLSEGDEADSWFQLLCPTRPSAGEFHAHPPSADPRPALVSGLRRLAHYRQSLSAVNGPASSRGLSWDVELSLCSYVKRRRPADQPTQTRCPGRAQRETSQPVGAASGLESSQFQQVESSPFPKQRLQELGNP